MATSSITKSFVVEGKEQVEKFADAIEQSYQDSIRHPWKPTVRYREIKNSGELKTLTEKWKMANVRQRDGSIVSLSKKI